MPYPLRGTQQEMENHLLVVLWGVPRGKTLMLDVIRKLLTNPGHDEYVCERKKCKTCELKDTGHFEALKEMNDEHDL